MFSRLIHLCIDRWHTDGMGISLLATWVIVRWRWSSFWCCTAPALPATVSSRSTSFPVTISVRCRHSTDCWVTLVINFDVSVVRELVISCVSRTVSCIVTKFPIYQIWFIRVCISLIWLLLSIYFTGLQKQRLKKLEMKPKASSYII